MRQMQHLEQESHLPRSHLLGTRRTADVGVLLLVSQVEAEVVDDEADVLLDLGELIIELTLGSCLAQLLELDDVVRVGGGGQAQQDALVGQEQRAGADAHESALLGGVILLQLGEGADEVERLGLLLENGGAVAARDDEHIVVLQLLVGLLPAELALDERALGREDVGLSACQGDLKGLGV
jgi:hypothetical protein